MKHLLSIVLTLSFISAEAQVTLLPDSFFEQKLIFLGLDTGNVDGSVPTSFIDTVTYLDVSGMPIQDMTGIEDFTLLKYLDCGGGQITTLNVTQNSSLRTLICDNNNLSSLDVTQNDSLTHLTCYWNQITSLDVTQNQELLELSCDANQISNIDVTQNTQLVKLTCGLMQMTSLNITQNPNLTYLFCQDNLITNLDISQNLSLQTISCGTNMITSMDVSQHLALKHFSCYENQLTKLDLSNNTQLISLTATNNQLTCLNLKNGNNAIMTQLVASQNPNLTCIEVDSVGFAQSHPNFHVDSTSSFSTNCSNPCVVGLAESPPTYIEQLYPNPTSKNITLVLKERTTSTFHLRNGLGQTVLFKTLKDADMVTIDLSHLPKSIYFLQLNIGDRKITKKIIKN